MILSGTGSNLWFQLVINALLLVVDDDIVTLYPPHPSRGGRGSGETTGNILDSQREGNRLWGALTWSASPDSSYS